MNQPNAAYAPVFAAIDVGSNSVKLRLARRARGRVRAHWEIAHDEVVVTGLGRGLTVRRTLDPTAAAATLRVLRHFSAIIAAHDGAGVACVATQCLREAEDGAAFAAAVRAATGLSVEIISGKEEARLAFLGACSDLPAAAADRDLVVIDVGGRSTEFGYGRRDRLEQSTSLTVGVLGLTERYLNRDPVLADDVRAARQDAAERLAELPTTSGARVIIGIGATPATLAAVQRGAHGEEATPLHGQAVAAAEVARQVELYAGLTVAERRQLPGLHPDRAQVILAGAVLLASALEHLRGDEIRVSRHGLRQGLLRDRFEESVA